ncbi:Phosphatidylinositol 3,4,5-trisphosphate-dependent Rac exchanger 2 protein [Phytophthora pseudosyringae]|uniref:Phosphatidylinositol 3,4,5-trisphosphate-dependent Rac exchanger 2 protein n=1 Tax=Phytophthora pseudosyringae TaxID=221518 RepID=A0A8T1W3F6_9STRA|nr:Phosphatidylinositol 3,4,5-trisphosphate-dependent Rac exchanger 2 protein [Phytophthora pseudosyringae]
MASPAPAVGRARPAATGAATIYDSYPLSLRTFLAEGPPPFVRSVSHSMEDPTQRTMTVDDDDFLSNLHNTSSSVGTIDLNDGVRTGATARPTALCSTFGKFHNEVFETKERSKVLSALRHRGKAAKNASGMKQRAPMRPTAPSTFTADDVLRAGTLTKQGSWRRNWKTRFFILRSDCPSLCYFTSEDKLELLGEIPITEDTIVLDRSGGGHAPFRFQIRTDAQTLLLEAESRENQKRWIDSCQELADAIRASKFSVNTSMSSFSGAIDGRRSSLLRGTTVTTFRPTERDVLEASASSQHWDEAETSAVDDIERSWKRRQNPQRLTASSASGSTRSAPQEYATVSQRRMYDLSISVLMGRRSKLARSVEHVAAADKDKDRTGCFVAVSGYIRSSKTFVELGATDVVKLTTLVTACGAASGAAGEQAPVPFSVVLTAELERYEQLRLTLCKTQLTQSPGNVQGTLGVGRCLLDEQLLGSAPCAVAVTERSTSSRDSLAGNNPLPQQQKAGEPGGPLPSGTGSSSSLATDSESVQLVVQAFRSVPPQSVLPTTGVNMANSKYLIPTTLAPGRETAGKIATGTRLDFPGSTRGSDVRTFMENDTFLTGIGLGALNEAPNGNLRFVAVDEILRVPRSTFALPVAYLDFLEEQALERSRWLQKRMHAKLANPREVERLNAELEFVRKKQEEYLKQRQFLIRQEKRLLDEQKDGKFFLAAKGAGMTSVVNERDSLGVSSSSAASSASAGGGTETEAVAPFKRSTYKNLNLWQFLPTNMQDQFLCTYKPPTSSTQGRSGASAPLSSRPFVWHTMTMGCPAAHTKGFANGGYPASVPVLTVNPTCEADDEPLLESSYEGDFQSPTSPLSSSRGGSSSGTLTKATLPSDDSLAAFKLRLELQDRLTVIGSQILSATAACLLASLDLALSGSALHQAQIDRAPTFGFLVNFESLLSTQGKEYGMLEDFAAGARWLRNVFIQFRRHSTTGTFFSLKKYTPPGSNAHDNNCLLLTMGIDDGHMSVLPQSLVSGDGVVHVRCVLFTQGVNEKQSLVHAYKSSAVKLQERVNRDNLIELKRVYALYRRLRTEETEDRVRESRRLRANSTMAADDADEAAMAIDRHDLQALDDLLVQIEHHICSPTSQYKKNVALLMDSSDFCRALGGARVTCCKSGKDRTAMSVTLEQARLLCAELQASQGAALCANMRLYGVRRRNVFMNTKADKFAFNEMQRKMLPDCYKPPVGTYKSGKT